MIGFFSVKNWDQYQHYKDRDPTWIKLYNRLLDDYEFGLLPDASKWHLIGIFLLASRYKNKIPADAAWVAKKIGATQIVDLTLLEKADFITINHTCTKTLAEVYEPSIPEKETEESREETELLSADADRRVDSFEDFWKAFPTDPLMSKKKAREYWDRLTPEDQAAAVKAIPAFRELCTARVNYRPVHAWRFLSERRFDGFAGQPQLDPVAVAAAKDRADKLLKRGKYAETYQ